MIKKLQFKSKNLFFTSDLHYNHDRPFVYKQRGFESIKDYNKGIIERWNSICDNNSTVFHLGDIIFNDPEGKELTNLLEQLNYKSLYLLWGNHLSGQRPLYKKFVKALGFPDGVEIYPLEYPVNEDKTVYFLDHYQEIDVDNQWVVLCHFPIIEHHSQDKGSFALCGHSHNQNDFSNHNGTKRLLDVGIDRFGGPISFKDVYNILSQKETTLRY